MPRSIIRYQCLSNAHSKTTAKEQSLGMHMHPGRAAEYPCMQLTHVCQGMLTQKASSKIKRVLTQKASSKIKRMIMYHLGHGAQQNAKDQWLLRCTALLMPC